MSDTENRTRYCPNPRCKEIFHPIEPSVTYTDCPFCGSRSVDVKPDWNGTWVADNLPDDMQSIQKELRHVRWTGVACAYAVGFLILFASTKTSSPILVFGVGLCLWFAVLNLACWIMSKKIIRKFRAGTVSSDA